MDQIINIIAPGTAQKWLTAGLRGSRLYILMILIAAAALPAEQKTGPRILIHSSPDRPVAGSTWTFTLLVDHGEPNEVDVLAPHFTGALLLEQVIKSPRIMSPGTDGSAWEIPSAVTPETLERWTVMEYRFLLNSPGSISLDPFTVITPHGQTMTAPFYLNVQRPRNVTETQNYRFVWEGTPTELKTGENAVFTLRSVGRNRPDIPEALLFQPPPGHILESIPLTPEEKEEGYTLKLRLIPLGAQPFSLERRQFPYNGVVCEIPALRIPVSRAPEKVPVRENQTDIVPVALPPLETAAQDHPLLFQKHRAECETIYGNIRNLWKGGYRADALAMLRQNERDHPAGAVFAIIRRKAEQALGFAGTNDEKRSLFRGNFPAHAEFAVLRETVVRRIPDRAGEEITRFREGQLVRLNGKPQHKTWIQVIAYDDNGTSGWVPEEKIIFY